MNDNAKKCAHCKEELKIFDHGDDCLICTEIREALRDIFYSISNLDVGKLNPALATHLINVRKWIRRTEPDAVEENCACPPEAYDYYVDGAFDKQRRVEVLT